VPRRLSLAAGAVLLAALAACSTPQQNPRMQPDQELDRPKQGSFFYNCENGDRVEVRFAPEAGVAVLIRGGERKELQQQRMTVGFMYSAGGTSIDGRGDRMQMTIPGFSSVQCQLER
jgi:hypothetical protein